MQTTVDVDELQKFDDMAEGWWDPKGQSRPLHDINPCRLQFITDHCRFRDQKVLDIGCGGGILVESMVKRGAHVTGIDASPALINTAKQHAMQSELNTENYEYVCSSIEAYALLHKQKFDIITCMELLEHVPDPGALLKTCTTLLKPQGKLFLSTLNRHPRAYLFAILGAEYIMKLLPKGTHHYDKFIRPSEMEIGLRQAGFTLETIEGMAYNPFTRSCRLTRDVSINYLMYASLN